MHLLCFMFSLQFGKITLQMSSLLSRFKQLKAEESKKSLNKALPSEVVEVIASTSEPEDVSDGESKVSCFFPIFLSFALLTNFRENRYFKF